MKCHHCRPLEAKRRPSEGCGAHRKSVIQKCAHLPALEPLMDSPPNILKCLGRTALPRDLLCWAHPGSAPLTEAFDQPATATLLLNTQLKPSDQNSKAPNSKIASPSIPHFMPIHFLLLISWLSATARRYVVQQFAKVLPNDMEARKAFVQSGSLQKLQEVRRGCWGVELISLCECHGDRMMRISSEHKFAWDLKVGIIWNIWEPWGVLTGLGGCFFFC